MELEEAIKIVLELAQENLLDEDDPMVKSDFNLIKEAMKQREAIEMVKQYIQDAFLWDVRKKRLT